MLSQKTRYALRSLIYLARQTGGGRASKSVSAGEIAQTQSVPRRYLDLILLDLKRGGLVESRRGPGGGYVLARPPEEINFAEVIRLLDGPIALVPCASLNFYARCGDCQDEATCAIRRVMVKVRDDAVETLAAITLGDASVSEKLAA